MTAGFKEYQGIKDPLSTELMKVCQEKGIGFIGPNCQGVINTSVGLCLPFGVMPPEKLKHGEISIISQSGSISWMTPLYLSHEIPGVNKVVSIGNKMDIVEVDALRTCSRIIPPNLSFSISKVLNADGNFSLSFPKAPNQ
jgi:acyl-CoA synthetase (NDP forming)